MTEQVMEFFENLDPQRRAVAEAMHRFLLSYPGMKVNMRYRIPFYDIRTWICYLNPVKPAGVELAFVRANELQEEAGLLSFRGRAQVAGVVWMSVSEINWEAIAVLLESAIQLDSGDLPA